MTTCLKCLITLSIFSFCLACNLPEQDSKQAANYYCKMKQIEQSTALLPNNNHKKTKIREKNLYLSKMNKIRKKYYKKGSRIFDQKFEDAFEEGKMACK